MGVGGCKRRVSHLYPHPPHPHPPSPFLKTLRVPQHLLVKFGAQVPTLIPLVLNECRRQSQYDESIVFCI
jgi:hypothetical protein